MSAIKDVQNALSYLSVTPKGKNTYIVQSQFYCGFESRLNSLNSPIYCSIFIKFTIFLLNQSISCQDFVLTPRLVWFLKYCNGGVVCSKIHTIWELLGCIDWQILLNCKVLWLSLREFWKLTPKATVCNSCNRIF